MVTEITQRLMPPQYAGKNLGKAEVDIFQEGEDIIWETWAPVKKDDDYLELQIWYPTSILMATPQDTGYLYQVALKHEGESAIDGLEKTELPIKNDNRQDACKLF